MPEAQRIHDHPDARVVSARQELMEICAHATEAELTSAIDALDPRPEATDIRPAETGLVMLRGRIGGSGAPFNFGEATVTRAAVRLGTGETGFSYLLGRSKTRARLAAVLEAAGQRPEYRRSIVQNLVRPVAERLESERRTTREEAEATRVEFFTLVRGED
ncbi:MAG: phosphonate C-P lyase system protein PhnG [Hyphomicrobium sp.]|nr:phosphonate C-P lyase system protein PhnG [Hyphomicrobium sp.]